MKFRADFVTNSSSVGYIVSVDAEGLDNFRSFMQALSEDPDASNEGVRTYMECATIEELVEHVNGGPFDWASKPFGLDFKNMDEGTFEKCKDAIEKNGVVMEVFIDYGVSEQFDNEYGYTVLQDLT